MDDPENSGRDQAGRFKPGKSGNLAGKPRGARHRASRAVEILLEGEAEELTRRVIDLAKTGDVTALRLCLDRVAPARKDSHITISLPSVDSAQSAVEAGFRVISAVAAGELSPDEGSRLMALLESQRRHIETHDLELRLTEIEKRMGQNK